MRGNAQNINMTEEMIDKIFNDYFLIKHLDITGGEPLLNIPLIKKVFETLEGKNISVYGLSITTNGTIRSEEFANILKQHSKRFKEISFTYSSDVFHKSQIENWEDEIKSTIEFYRERGIELIDLKNPASYDSLSYTGRAKDLKGKVKRFKWDKKNHMIEFLDKENFYELPYTSLYYSANGNIYLASVHSYDDVDQENLGNVMDDKFIIDKIFYWNIKYPITQKEYGIYKFFKGLQELNGYKDKKIEEQIVVEVVDKFENLLELRKKLIGDFPQYTTENIIECTSIDKYIYPEISRIFGDKVIT